MIAAFACTPGAGGGGQSTWHPAVTAAERKQDVAVASAVRQGHAPGGAHYLPAAMSRMPMPKQVLSVGIGNRGLLEPMAFGIISGESCDATYPEMTAGLKDLGLTVLSTGYSSTPATSSLPAIVIGWLVVRQDDGAAVSLTFTQGPLGENSCNVQGIGFTPVHLLVSGGIGVSGDALASVGCLAWPGHGFTLSMWGAAVAGHTISILANFKTAAVGDSPLDKNSGSSNTLFDLPVYGYTNAFGLSGAQSQKPDESKVAVITGGTARLAKGLASGTLNLTYQNKATSGTITGAFMCGTAPLTAAQQAPPSPSPSSAPASLPAKFPAAFPIYPGSTLTSAESAALGGSTQVTADWTTTDNLDKVYAFYADALKNGDWEPDIGGATHGANSASIFFKSRSKPGLGGALTLDAKKQPGRVLISVLFNVPG